MIDRSNLETNISYAVFASRADDEDNKLFMVSGRWNNLAAAYSRYCRIIGNRRFRNVKLVECREVFTVFGMGGGSGLSTTDECDVESNKTLNAEKLTDILKNWLPEERQMAETSYAKGYYRAVTDVIKLIEGEIDKYEVD